MKILFICGSLEPGQDGVGDYTRRLAGGLIRQGHESQIIALNDRYVKNVSEELQETEDTQVHVLRLPELSILTPKTKSAKKFIHRFDPNWISLQFVIYSFQEKGLPFLLGRFLKNIGENRNWHIMFHELWVGLEKEASFKYQLVGKLQKRIINNVLKLINPKSIHTQSQVYHLVLQELGINNKILPLFSNIPNTSDIKIRNHSYSNNSTITLVHFGSIRPGGPIEDFAQDIETFMRENNREVQIIFLGKSGKEIHYWKRILKENKIPYQEIGEQNEDAISRILRTSDWGLCTTPVLLIDKSGSFACMMEHGLPVYCVARPWVISVENQFVIPENIRVYKKGDLDLSLLADRASCKNLLSQVIMQLTTDLYEQNAYIPSDR